MELRPDESLFRTTKSSYVSFVVRQGALVVCGPCKSVAAREICRWDASIWRPDRPNSAGRAARAGYWSLNSESISCEHFAAINCVRIPTVAVGFSRVGAMHLTSRLTFQIDHQRTRHPTIFCRTLLGPAELPRCFRIGVQHRNTDETGRSEFAFREGCLPPAPESVSRHKHHERHRVWSLTENRGRGTVHRCEPHQERLAARRIHPLRSATPLKTSVLKADTLQLKSCSGNHHSSGIFLLHVSQPTRRSAVSRGTAAETTCRKSHFFPDAVGLQPLRSAHSVAGVFC